MDIDTALEIARTESRTQFQPMMQKLLSTGMPSEDILARSPEPKKRKRPPMVIHDSEDELDSDSPEASATVRAHSDDDTQITSYIIPAYILERVLALPNNFDLKSREPLLIEICKYWSLKRSARRGAPLLKRLHLEV